MKRLIATILMVVAMGTSAFAQPNSGPNHTIADVDDSAVYVIGCDAFIYAFDWAKLNPCWNNWVIVTESQSEDIHHFYSAKWPITVDPGPEITIYDGRTGENIFIGHGEHNTAGEVQHYVLNGIKLILPPL